MTELDVLGLLANRSPRRGPAREDAAAPTWGLRRAEVVGLDLSDFDPATGKLIVRGKRNKERAGWVTNGSRDALDAWLVRRGSEPGPLFMPVSKAGTIMRRRMTDGAIAELVRRRARRSKIAAFSPHDMRRTFIGDMLDAGADIATVQQLAGHASPTTTVWPARRPGEETRRRAAACSVRQVVIETGLRADEADLHAATSHDPDGCLSFRWGRAVTASSSERPPMT